MNKYTIRKIITPVNLNGGHKTGIVWAEQLSKIFKAHLVLYNAIRPSGDEGQLYTTIHGNKINDLLKSTMARIQELGKKLIHAYKVGYSVEMSASWRNLVNQIRTEQADLLITELPPKGQSISGQLTALMYNISCPALFVREGAEPAPGKKILVAVRMKERLKEILPAVVTWAKAYDSEVILSAFQPDNISEKDKLHLGKHTDEMAQTLIAEGINVEIESAHGFHFGTAILERARQTDAGMIIIGIEPENFFAHLFTKMTGPFFLENANLPVLTVPLLNKNTASTTPDDLSASRATAYAEMPFPALDKY